MPTRFRLPSIVPPAKRAEAKDVHRYVARITEVWRKKGRAYAFSLKMWKVVSLKPRKLGSRNPEGQFLVEVALDKEVFIEGRFRTGDVIDLFAWTIPDGKFGCCIRKSTY